jgi:hypothetical protein
MFRPVARLIETGTLLKGEPAEVVRKNQLAAMYEATQLGTRLVKEHTPQGAGGARDGGLISTIKPEVRQSTHRVTGIIGTTSPYGLVVEKGRRPGQKMPPGSDTYSDLATRSLSANNPGPLVRWIEVKFGVSREEALRIEYPVRWKIRQKGTKGAFMFEKTLKEDWADFQAIFERYGVRIGRELER